jgi:DNA polymerase-3 subunit delta'
MNLQAANSFLKTLEEPTPSTVLILIASNLHQLLPTIISRCQKIKFSPLTTQSVQKILRSLEDMQPEELELRSAHARGQVVRALEYDITQSSQYRQDLLKLIENVSFENAELVFEWARTWSKQTDKISAVLDQLMILLRDLAFIKSHASVNHLYNKDLSNLLNPLSAKKSLPEILSMFDSVQQTKYALLANANTQLSLENMLLRFCDAA